MYRENPGLPPEQRFWSRIKIQDSGCWLWTGGMDSSGYGRFWADGQIWRAYEWVYVKYVGSVPSGCELDHQCNVRRCINPFHLKPMTHRENVLRGTSPAAFHARKTHCIRGHLLPDKRNGWGRRVCKICKDRRQAQYAAEGRYRKPTLRT